jgi:hypothetical protein
MNKGYAFIVENDVFYTMFFPESLSIANRWVAGLSSSPNFVECSLYPEVCVGAVRSNNNFYLPTDPNTALLEIDPGAPQYTLKVAAIVGEEVFGLITFPIEDFTSEMIDYLRAGFSSSPIVVECSSETSVSAGWTWDGLNFYPPQEG